jgi:hypothetical protein
MNLCTQPVGLRKTVGGPSRSGMSSNVPNTEYPADGARMTGVWTMGGINGDSTLANGINYFELDLGNEYAVRGLLTRGGEAAGQNLARGKVATSKGGKWNSDKNKPSKAVDGGVSTNSDSCFISHSDDKNSNPWLKIDLVNPTPVGLVRILRRNDACGSFCKRRLSDFEVLVSNQNDIASVTDADTCGGAGKLFTKSDFGSDEWANIDCGKKGIQGRYVYIRLKGRNSDGTFIAGNVGANQQFLTLCEVEVFSAESYVAVTKYSLQRSLDGKKYMPIKANQQIEVFQGNYDRSSDVESELSFPATARYIRVIPLQCNGACAGNFEVLAGPVEKCQVVDNVALTGDTIIG